MRGGILECILALEIVTRDFSGSRPEGGKFSFVAAERLGLQMGTVYPISASFVGDSQVRRGWVVMFRIAGSGRSDQRKAARTGVRRSAQPPSLPYRQQCL